MLFNTDMVRALLDGSKTVTRRAMRPQPPDYFVPCPICPWWSEIWIDGIGNVKLPYLSGDILYVRETWSMISEWTNVDPDVGMFEGYIYKADWTDELQPRWHPSIHMPKEAARIFLRVKDVRVERLQCITRAEALKEGANPACAVMNFKVIWDGTIKPTDCDKYGWDANPWVWVIEFERVERPEGDRNDD